MAIQDAPRQAALTAAPTVATAQAVAATEEAVAPAVEEDELDAYSDWTDAPPVAVDADMAAAEEERRQRDEERMKRMREAMEEPPAEAAEDEPPAKKRKNSKKSQKLEMWKARAKAAEEENDMLKAQALATEEEKDMWKAQALAAGKEKDMWKAKASAAEKEVEALQGKADAESSDLKDSALKHELLVAMGYTTALASALGKGPEACAKIEEHATKMIAFANSVSEWVEEGRDIILEKLNECRETETKSAAESGVTCPMTIFAHAMISFAESHSLSGGSTSKVRELGRETGHHLLSVCAGLVPAAKAEEEEETVADEGDESKADKGAESEAVEADESKAVAAESKGDEGDSTSSSTSGSDEGI